MKTSRELLLRLVTEIRVRNHLQTLQCESLEEALDLFDEDELDAADDEFINQRIRNVDVADDPDQDDGDEDEPEDE